MSWKAAPLLSVSLMEIGSSSTMVKPNSLSVNVFRTLSLSFSDFFFLSMFLSCFVFISLNILVDCSLHLSTLNDYFFSVFNCLAASYVWLSMQERDNAQRQRKITKDATPWDGQFSTVITPP